MFTLAGLALPAVTSLFAALIPLVFASLGSLLGFAIPRAAQLPRYIKLLVLLYQDSSSDSQTRKYTTSALLILGGILTFMAHSFVPFTGVPVISAITTPIALLIASVVILATLDLVTNLNEPYLDDLKFAYSDDFQDMQDDLLTLKNMLGPDWVDLTRKVKKVFDDLTPKLAELGQDLSGEINKYFSNQLSELIIYFNGKDASKISLTEPEIKIISESLEPWKKVGGSLVLGSLTGAGTGMLASTVAASSLAPAAWWAPFVPGVLQGVIYGGKTVVTATTFSLATVAAPVALGITLGTGVFSATMFALGKVEEQKISQFLADIIIASLPMIRVDGQSSDEEKDAVIQLLANPQINNLDKERVKAALASDDSFDDIIDQNLLHEQKEEKGLMKRRLLLAITWEIAKADGRIDQREIALHDRMAKILQIDEKTVAEIRRLITPKALPASQSVTLTNQVTVELA
ncbi:TerB family tellurite resistance protein [Cyanobacteria bacterium FACHB-471]|nr:TerB family tellurite resistance protein [Cyanobacteria bacterium FACHB-471]